MAKMTIEQQIETLKYAETHAYRDIMGYDNNDDDFRHRDYRMTREEREQYAKLCGPVRVVRPA